MKYILMPFWRVIVALWVTFAQIILILAWIMIVVWSFKIPEWDPESWYYSIDDDELGAISRAYRGDPVRYYRNPWEALFGKITYRKP
jgi:hypothetical protein